MQQQLLKRFPNQSIDVINAGIVGLGLKQQAVLFERRVSRLKPDITIVHPGFNDFADYRRRKTKEQPWVAQPLVEFRMPLVAVDRTAAEEHG